MNIWPTLVTLMRHLLIETSGVGDGGGVVAAVGVAEGEQLLGMGQQSGRVSYDEIMISFELQD